MANETDFKMRISFDLRIFKFAHMKLPLSQRIIQQLVLNRESR